MSNVALGIHHVKTGLAQELGALDPNGRGYALSKADIGTDVSGYLEKRDPAGAPRAREKFPQGHRYFFDCTRETHARFIAWSMRQEGDSWFVTLTFKSYVRTSMAHWLLNRWLSAICDAYQCKAGARGLRWIIVQEWQKRQVIHFHLILSGVRLDELSRKRWESRWEGIAGGYARIYEAREKAAPYLAKYVVKNDTQDGAMRRGGYWRGMTPPRSTNCCRT